MRMDTVKWLSWSYLPGEHSIKVNPNAKGVIHSMRRQPALLKPRIIEKRREMEFDGCITPVEKPTQSVRWLLACGTIKWESIDPKYFIEAIKREHHPMKTVEEVASSIPGAKLFSVLDAKPGYMQIKLDNDSSYLTTFNTAIGRFCWLRLPSGIKSTEEIYQRIMDQMLEGIEEAFAIMDDILIAGRDREHLGYILRALIERAIQYNLRLNFDKCRVRRTSLPYVGHVISTEGIRPDPEKLRAVCDIPPPMTREAVRRFLGIVQYLSKFILYMSEINLPLRELFKAEIKFQWNHTQQESFDKLKTACTTTHVLVLFDVSKLTEIHCDASKDGLGAILLQDGRAIAYSSRVLSDTEKRYAQIEKEMLSVVHGASKFHCYVFWQTSYCVQWPDASWTNLHKADVVRTYGTLKDATFKATVVRSYLLIPERQGYGSSWCLVPSVPTEQWTGSRFSWHEGFFQTYCLSVGRGRRTLENIRLPSYKDYIPSL